MNRKNSKKVISQIVLEFHTYAVHISNKVNDSKAKILEPWTVPIRLNSHLFVLILGITRGWESAEGCDRIAGGMVDFV